MKFSWWELRVLGNNFGFLASNLVCLKIKLWTNAIISNKSIIPTLLELAVKNLSLVIVIEQLKWFSFLEQKNYTWITKCCLFSLWLSTLASLHLPQSPYIPPPTLLCLLCSLFCWPFHFILRSSSSVLRSSLTLFIMSLSLQLNWDLIFSCKW